MSASENIGMGLYIKAMLCELYHGALRDPTEWHEKVIRVELVTDCKSLFDHMARDAKLSLCRQTALNIVSLRGVVFACPERGLRKIGMRWAASAAQLADGLTRAGLGHTIRDWMRRSSTKCHEISKQEQRRRYSGKKS